MDNGEWYPFGIKDWQSITGRTYTSVGVSIDDAINSLMVQFDVMFVERFARKPEIEEKAFFINNFGKPGKQITERELAQIGKGLFELIVAVGQGNHTHYYRIFGTIEKEGIIPKWKLNGQAQFIQ